jgi:hypothetical protein
MYLKYGSYSHNTGECDINISRKSEYNDAMNRWAIRERWQINGLLTNPTGDLSTMQTLTGSLITAYGTEGLDLTFHLPDDSVTQHALYTANCLGGTKVIKPVSFPTGEGTEAITYRTYTVVVEGLILVGSETLKSFSETLTFSGGGPAYGHLECMIGLPVKQKLRNYTIYRVTQSGEAVGILAYPAVPGPIWPPALIKAPRIQRKSPRKYGSSYIDYPTTWSYEFESSAVLVGNPNVWS